jgi:hypothetical protein
MRHPKANPLGIKPMKRFTDFAVMVDHFLDRREANAEAVRLLAYLGEFANVTVEADFLEELQSVEAAGGLVVKRQRIDGIDTIASIRLGDVDVLYRYRGRTPSNLAAEASLEPVRRRADLPGAAADVLNEVEDAWSRNVSWMGIRKGQAEVLDQALSLARALSSLSLSAESSIDYRTLSRRAAGDSKILERQIRAVVALFSRLYPSQIQDNLADEDLLAALGIERLPQPLLLGGPLLLDDRIVPTLPFFGLPPDQHHRLAFGPADYLLMIENYTSFVRHCRELNGDRRGLVIYTGGFPAKGILAAIVGIASRANVPTFHWGDLDPGGLRIFVHIESALREVGVPLRPHLMDVRKLRERGREENVPTRPLVAGQAAGSAVSEIWDALASASPYLQLEQEELDPHSPSSR